MDPIKGAAVGAEYDEGEQVEMGVSAGVSKSRHGAGKAVRELVAAVSFKEEFDDMRSVSSSVRGSTNMLRLQARQIVKQLYPKVERKPTLQELVDTVLAQEGEELSFKRGDWVEYLGDDMIWHVEQIRGVVRQAPDDWDWSAPENEGLEPKYEKLYKVGGDKLRSAETVRATEQALQRIFGQRPWVFQQWAMLGLERQVRFQEDHEDDFEEVDCQQYVVDKWLWWLKHPDNEEFRKLFESYNDAQQEALEACIFTPFELLDNITESDSWHFEDDDISIFTYTSILGSGNLLALGASALQFVIPTILVLNALEESPRFEFSEANDYSLVVNEDKICAGESKLNGKAIIFSVLIMYVTTVVPEVLLRFYRTVGDAATSYSRLSSLRQMVWRQQDDTIVQKMGYKMDMYMNAGYPALLYVCMLFILFNTDNVLDILLNALAVEFVQQIDEQIAASGWYDPDNRWISAGAWSLAAQATVRLRVLEDPAAFCAKYDINPEDYVDALKPELADEPKASKLRAFPYLSLSNPARALKDDVNPRYWSNQDEAVKIECANYARKNKNEEALRQFEKQTVNFSLYDQFVTDILPYTQSTGIFDQFKRFRTWGMWEEVLFLPPVPTRIEDIEEEVATDKVKRFQAKERTTMDKFIQEVMEVLTLTRYFKDVSRVIYRNRKRTWLEILPLIIFTVFDGILQWFFYVIILSFPVFIVAATVIIPICY